MTTRCSSKASNIKLPSNHLIKALAGISHPRGPFFIWAHFITLFKANLFFQRRKMQMTRFERKCITLCIMTGDFLGKQEGTGRAICGGWGWLISPTGTRRGDSLLHGVQGQQNCKHQSADNHPLSPFAASSTPCFETRCILWTSKTKAGTDK